MATIIILSDDLAVYGQSVLATGGQILLAAHRPCHSSNGGATWALPGGRGT